MKRYVDYLSSQAADGVINSNLGDWYDYGHGKGDGPSQWTPPNVTASAVWALAAHTRSRAAGVLMKSNDAGRYVQHRERIRSDFLRHFYDASSNTVANRGSCQAANPVALCAGLIPDQDSAAAVQAIVDDLEHRGWQQTTGEVLQVFLIRALAEAGRGDVLHRVFAREDRGGYGCMVKSGLTTLPETGDAKPGTGNSMNHFMLGHLVEWHFAYGAGIRQQSGDVGWRNVLIAPDPGPLTHDVAVFDSPAGRIETHWRTANGEFELTTIIPFGVEATAVLPDGSRSPLPAGRTVLRCPY